MSDFVRAQAFCEHDAVGKGRFFFVSGTLISDSCPSLKIVSNIYVQFSYINISHNFTLPIDDSASSYKQQFNKI